jgi:hypothetical protein
MATDAPPATEHWFVPKMIPHILQHHEQSPVKVADQATPGLNGKIALILTKSVGTMWCAYAFAILAIIGFPIGSASPRDYVVWLSQTFIQLTMLSVIMVGQNLLSAASDKRAEDTWKDADATFHTAHQIQEHLSIQDGHLAEQAAKLENIIAALKKAFPEATANL